MAVLDERDKAILAAYREFGGDTPTLAEAREVALRLTPEDRHLLALDLSSDVVDGSAFWTEMRERIRSRAENGRVSVG